MAAYTGTTEAVGFYACGNYFEFYPKNPLLQSLKHEFETNKCDCGSRLNSVSASLYGLDGEYTYANGKVSFTTFSEKVRA